MSLKFYWIVYQKQCCLLLLPVVLIVIIVAVLIRRAGDLEVAQVPQIEPSHIQRASELSKQGNHHVIIIGAGAAGMSAAYTLEYLGLTYTLLEASSTFGGRVQEMSNFTNVPLDLGAEWIHVMPRVLQDLLLFPQDRNAVLESTAIMDYQPQSIGFNKGGGKRRSHNWFSHFYQEYKFVNTTWWSYFATYFYPRIQDHVVLNAFVNRIEYNNNNIAKASSPRTAVTVTTNDGRQFTASHVIVAAPIRILQDREIVLLPDLDQRTWQVIDSVEVADGIKVWFQWDEDFYPDLQFTQPLLGGAEYHPMYFDAVWGKATNDHVLCLFNVNQDQATERATWSDEEIVQDAVEELEEIFDRNNLKAQLKQSKVQNWSREPFIRGAYTWNYGYYDQDALRQSFYNGHLFLAGEHVAAGSEYVSTVHGAAITGREAVLKILSQSVE